jgi:8-oxo-dGTP pyrophosphatase MutT (NUDIX family)
MRKPSSEKRGGRQPATAPRVGAPGPGRRRTKAKLEHHHSAGGLVVHRDRILLISTRAGRRWQLPKGHLEAGETSEQAAIRETREETGVSGRVVAPLPHIDYAFSERGVRIRKRVDYYLLAYESGDPADFDPVEVSGAGWFSWEDGLARLTFDNERRVAEAAYALHHGTATRRES